MDKGERQRLKQLANDAIIATFGQETNEARLAQALEQCVDELGFIGDECEHCKFCFTHGDHDEDAPLVVEVDDVMGVHYELKKLLQRLKDYHVKLSGELTESYDDNLAGSTLPEDLAEIIEETESQIDELEALTIV